MSGSEIADMLHRASWTECGAHLRVLSSVPEALFEQPFEDETTLLNQVRELEGLTRFVLESLMGDRPDERETTFDFDAGAWSSIPDDASKGVLLSVLESTCEDLQRKILACPDAALLEHSRPMWTPGVMDSPAAAILQLTRLSAFQRGQLAQLIKDLP